MPPCLPYLYNLLVTTAGKLFQCKSNLLWSRSLAKKTLRTRALQYNKSDYSSLRIAYTSRHCSVVIICKQSRRFEQYFEARPAMLSLHLSQEFVHNPRITREQKRMNSILAASLLLCRLLIVKGPAKVEGWLLYRTNKRPKNVPYMRNAIVRFGRRAETEGPVHSTLHTLTCHGSVTHETITRIFFSPSARIPLNRSFVCLSIKRWIYVQHPRWLVVGACSTVHSSTSRGRLGVVRESVR